MSARNRREYDFIVVGSGVAGLWTAVHLARHGRVAVLTKDAINEGSTGYAQGGVAVALSEGDDPELHLRDTLEAGDGLCDVPAVEMLTFEGPGAVRELIAYGAQFDMARGEYMFGREAAHSHRRILHANGDQTGAEIERALVAAARASEQIDVLEHTGVGSLLMADGRCIGVQAHDFTTQATLFVTARATAFATGGVGCLYRVTTNPPVITGDGLALAYRAGARLADIEFVQFHPTALAAPGFPKFLLSEALRGDGARLRNARGEAFMKSYHALGDLAPRDEVARAVTSEMKAAQQPFVYLDLAPIGRQRLEERFPAIVRACREHGFDVPDTPVPVCPAAHYTMGGIDVDLDCRTSLPGLYAVGECSCVSVHGANRLASNSLLEGIVFGPRCAAAMSREQALDEQACRRVISAGPHVVEVGSGFYHDLLDLMWDNMGVVRSDATLRGAIQFLAHTSAKVGPSLAPTRYGIEQGNGLLVGKLMAAAALNRWESRGAHYRLDCDETSDQLRQHTVVYKGDDGAPVLEFRPVDLQRMRFEQ